MNSNFTPQEHPALYQTPARDTPGIVVCTLCPHACRLRDGESGRCRVRRQQEGVLVAENWNRVAALSLDPVEKKPLAFFMPGTRTWSVGFFGCNMRCVFCQNTHLSMADLDDDDPVAAQRVGGARHMTPEDIVRGALDAGAPSVSYTYNEPLVAYESVLETAQLARRAGLRNILVTNGYINPEPMAQLLPYIDAMNIDLKTFDDDVYRSWCGGRLQPVLHTIRQCADACHVEVTTLVVTGMNDSLSALTPAFEWLGSVDPNLPLHITRAFPANRWAGPPAPVRLLETLRDAAGKELRHVLLGNI